MKRLFISHSWAYNKDYEKIEEFLNKENVSFYNHSVPKDDPVHTGGSDTKLKQAIEAKISGCSCVIVPAGLYVEYSKWIKIEIDMAVKHNKRIIGVKKFGAERCSTTVQDAADIIVGWNSKSIANAVKN